MTQIQALTSLAGIWPRGAQRKFISKLVLNLNKLETTSMLSNFMTVLVPMSFALMRLSDSARLVQQDKPLKEEISLTEERPLSIHPEVSSLKDIPWEQQVWHNVQSFAGS